MDENTEFRTELEVKWLRVLMYIAITSLVNSLVDYLPFVPPAVTTWVSRGIMLAMAVCMLQMAPANKRYRTAGIMRAIMLGCALFTAFVSGSTILTLTASIVSIIAVYQEYCAHSELIGEKDQKLAGKWHTLFTWTFLATVILSFGTTVVAVLLVLLDPDVNASLVSGIAIALLSIPPMILQVIYLSYLKKMIGILE